MLCVQRIVFDLGKILFTDIIDLTLVERESTTVRCTFLPFLYSSFHNLAFVGNIIHQCQQSGCFLSLQPCRKTSTFILHPASLPWQAEWPDKPTITHWYGWTIFVIYYWIDFSSVCGFRLWWVNSRQNFQKLEQTSNVSMW